MITVDDVKLTLGDRIELDNGYVGAEDFANIFFDAVSMSYTDLMTSDRIEKDGVVSSKGYREFFAKCKTEGKLI